MNSPFSELEGINNSLRKNHSHNSGDDIAGIVHAVGKSVYEFKPGDRVAGFHEVGTPNGSFAEYSVSPDWTTFHIPNNVSFEEAATVPLAALTAMTALYGDMRLPTPWDELKVKNTKNRVPFLIYGVTSAVGAFGAKLARLSGLGPIISVAGRAKDFAKTLSDHVVDYREGEDAVVANVQKILKEEGLGTTLPYIFDAISENESFEVTKRLIDTNGGVISTVLPTQLFAKNKEGFSFPEGVTAFNPSAVPFVHSTRKDEGYMWSRCLGRLLEDGRLTAHPFEIVPGGLNGVLNGLQKLKDGKASGLKYVYKIEETGDSITATHRNKGGQSSEQKPHPLSNFPFPSVK